MSTRLSSLKRTRTAARSGKIVPLTLPADTADAFTVPKAADYLVKGGAKKKASESLIIRLIHKQELAAAKVCLHGKRKWMIERWSLDRYRLLQGWSRQLGGPPLARGPGDDTKPSLFAEQLKGLAKRHAFAPQGSYRGVHREEMTVSLREFLHYTGQHTRRQQDKIKEQVRQRINGRPKDFIVLFCLDSQETFRTLEGVIAKTP
jgi:hypothetical protein